MIHFNVPPVVENQGRYMQQAVDNHKVCGDGDFTKKCTQWLEDRFGIKKVLLTTSGTAALEMAAFLCGIKEGDEVILPSYTFSSTANAFILAGARLKFIDIEKDTMNIDPAQIESAITDRTRAICVVHYAGVACDMDRIMSLADHYGIHVIEDAAQGIMSTYHGKPLGTIGLFGAFSFHETKNFSMGEGGALLINDEKYIERAEILREKGTNRSKYYRGEIAKYNWVDYGSSYLPSDILAANLWAQLEEADKIQQRRMEIWNRYNEEFKGLKERNRIELPRIPNGTVHNAHMFYLKMRDLEDRTSFIDYMKKNDILTVFHYVPLHSAPAGEKYGMFCGEDRYTSSESDRLVRMPLYYNMTKNELDKVCAAAKYYLDEVSP